MYITCQKCNTNFVVKFEQIGSKGRKVRCSKCRHTWHADPIIAPDDNDSLTPKTELLKPIEGKIHLPVVLKTEQKKSSSDRIIFLTIFFILSCVLFFSKFINFDNLTTGALKLSDVKIQHIKNSNKMNLRYTISNEGNHVTNMPDIRIQLFDDKNNLIDAYDMIGAEVELDPHQHLKFRTELPSVPSGVNAVNMTIINKVDLIFK